MGTYYWYTWLAYFGLLAGIVVSAVMGLSLMRSALFGFAGGVVLVTLWNVTMPPRAYCLQESKGVEILRSYNLNCVRPVDLLLPGAAPRK
jgi:hypothetical protein